MRIPKTYRTCPSVLARFYLILLAKEALNPVYTAAKPLARLAASTCLFDLVILPLWLVSDPIK